MTIARPIVLSSLMLGSLLPLGAPAANRAKHPVEEARSPRPRSGATALADFNGDGYGDLAIGVIREDVGTIRDAGAVNVIYGSPTGLTEVQNQFWTEDSPGIRGRAAASDAFGRSLAAGDFNGDGFSDLAVGVPYKDVNGAKDAGAINVIYGSAAGLTSVGNQLWAQGLQGILDKAEWGDRLGRALVTADFNGDGYDDLAATANGEDVGAVFDAGAATVIYGSAAGLTATGNQFWTQDSPGIRGMAEEQDHLGWGLTAGDFNGDGFGDVALGVPGDRGTSDLPAPGIGAVNVIYGSPAGLDAYAGPGNQLWTQDSPGILDQGEIGDAFGRALTAGDFNGDGTDDLVVGVPYESLDNVKWAGAVNVIYGSGAGLTDAGNQFWNQDSPDIRDVAEPYDQLGRQLGAGDFTGDGIADLAVGVVGEDIGAISDAGAVNVIYGSSTGLDAYAGPGNQFWNQDSPGIQGEAEALDRFGRSNWGQDFNGDGFSDLAVGTPGDTVGTVQYAGSANVIYGSAIGLDVSAGPGNQLWNQDSPGILDVAETDDDFGAALPAAPAGAANVGG